jgi:tetratricopeptide (TPR) repeat protein
MFYVAIVLVALAIVAGWWYVFGTGPRRRRASARASRLLRRGNWSAALALVEKARGLGRLSPVWEGRLRSQAGECHNVAADQAIREGRFEDGLQHYLTAAPLLNVDPREFRGRVVEAMLAETRRLFAAGTGSAGLEAVEGIIGRTLAVQAECPEARFWLGLCQVRRGQRDQALATLTTAYEQAGKRYLDPALYLGILLHREGRPAEALRYLAEANRMDANCPFVTWQMGQSLVAAGGDGGLAVRALQRALGPRGFGLWLGNASTLLWPQTMAGAGPAAARARDEADSLIPTINTDEVSAKTEPARAWVEAFPEARSFVRRLAAKHRFVCPLLGADLTAIYRQGQLALGQALYRQGNYQDAADLFGKLLQDCPPTVPLLRGYGLALARLERYDQAYKHLHIALEQEEPKDPLTAGYLALCGALGKPTREEDKPKNVAWAIRLLARYHVPDSPEWAGVYGSVFAEARRIGLPLPVEDQVRLCDTLAGVHAADEMAAFAYAHLAATYPDAVKPAHAWLYCQAAHAHGVTTERDLDLFGRTFRDPEPARSYFAARGWNFAEIEYTYLERCATRHPGVFPEALGPDYAGKGEAFLLERSRREEQAGQMEKAIAAAEVLLRLLPSSTAGHDRLASLHYRRGDLEGAVALLSSWQRLAPADHWPLVRQAIIEQERGNAERREETINRALGLTRGPLRAAIAFLGARLALRKAPTDRAALDTATALLSECLKEQPDHVDALWCLAAVRSVGGDREALAAQAPRMNRPDVTDPRFHYLGAVCHLAAGNYATVLDLARRAATDETLAADSQFLMAWAYLHRNEEAAARATLEKVVASNQGHSADNSRALLGRLSLAAEDYEGAARWWTALDARLRAEWNLDEPLRQTVFLSGLQALKEDQFEPAAERFREAGRLGLRDRRLGPLLTLALVKAGLRLLYAESITSRQ